MTLTRLSELDGEAILPLLDAKKHLRVRHTDEDDLIRSLRDAACEYVERTSGVALTEALYRWEGRGFADFRELPLRPATEIVSVEHTGPEEELVEYEGARLLNGAVWPAAGQTWPTSYGWAAVTFIAGADEAPADLQAAVKLLLGHLYMNREAVTTGPTPVEVPLSVEALISTRRRVKA